MKTSLKSNSCLKSNKTGFLKDTENWFKTILFLRKKKQKNGLKLSFSKINSFY
jgi:hypothetical protein